MHKKTNIIIVLGIGIILLITSVIAIFLSNQNSNPENPSTNPSNPTPEEVKLNSNFSRLIEEKRLFELQNIINNFYQNISIGNNEKVYKLLDSNYSSENNITEENAIEFFNIEYENTYFTLENAYYNPDSDITYYFVHGYYINAPVGIGEIKYESSKNFLVIVGKNDYYVIRPLLDTINILDYANSYNVTLYDIPMYNRFVDYNITEENKIMSYLSNYINILYKDTAKSYNMLDESMKEKYYNLEIFENDLANVYNSILINYIGKTRDAQSDRVIYTLTDANNRTMKIIEYYPLDYKISF